MSQGRRNYSFEGEAPLCSAVDARKAPTSPNGHGLRPPVGSLLAAKRAQPFRSEAKKGVSVVSPQTPPSSPKPANQAFQTKITLVFQLAGAHAVNEQAQIVRLSGFVVVRIQQRRHIENRTDA